MNSVTHKILAAFLLFLSGTQNSFAAWQDIGANLPGGTLTQITPDPADENILYGVSNSTLFKSIDNGQSWNKLWMNTKRDRLLAVAVAPSNNRIIYVGTDHGIFRSQDAGATFAELASSFRLVEAIAIDPTNSNIIYAEDLGDLQKSTDGGMTWTQVLHATNIGAIVFDPLDHTHLFVGTPSGVYETRNSGATFLRITEERTLLSFDIDSTNPQIMYAAAAYYGQGLIKSTDGGATWQNTLLINTHISGLKVDPSNSKNIYAISPGVGAMKSSDSGATWEKIRNSNQHNNTTALAVNRVGNIFVATSATGPEEGGVFRSVDNGATFSVASRGLNNAPINDFVIAGSSLVAATSYGIFRSTDDGNSWTNASGSEADICNRSFVKVAASPVNPNNLMAVCAKGGLVAGYGFASTDNGITWKHLPSVVGTSSFTFSPTDSNTVFSTSRRSLDKSTNLGGHWEPIYYGDDEIGDFMDGLKFDPKDPNTAYIVYEGSIYESHDAGDHFFQTSGNNNAITCAVDSTRSSTIYAGTRLNVRTSSDGGSTWGSNPNNLMGISSIVTHRELPGMVFAGGSYNGFGIALLKSADYGQTWMDISEDLPFSPVTALNIKPGQQISAVYVSLKNGGLFKNTDF